MGSSAASCWGPAFLPGEEHEAASSHQLEDSASRLQPWCWVAAQGLPPTAPLWSTSSPGNRKAFQGCRRTNSGSSTSPKAPLRLHQPQAPAQLCVDQTRQARDRVCLSRSSVWHGRCRGSGCDNSLPVPGLSGESFRGDSNGCLQDAFGHHLH